MKRQRISSETLNVLQRFKWTYYIQNTTISETNNTLNDLTQTGDTEDRLSKLNTVQKKVFKLKRRDKKWTKQSTE